MSSYDPREGEGYNLSDPHMSFCLGEAGPSVRRLGDSAARESLEARLSGPHACELRELDLARDVARRLRTELIYGMPAEAQVYDEQDVPTSLNLPMFMEFIFKALTGKEDPGEQFE